MEELKRRLDKVETRFDAVDVRLDKVEGRLEKVETHVGNIRVDVASISTAIIHTATKGDVKGAQLSMIMWMIGMFVGLAGLMVAVAKFVH